MATVEDIKSIISEAGTIGATDTLTSDTSLLEQGIDSLDMATIYLMIEEKYNIKIPDETIDQLDSIESIVSYVQEFNTA